MKKKEKIRMENVCFSYKDQTILENITVSFPENSIVAVTGPSGTGKSTFLSLFNRLWETFGEGRLYGKLFVRFGDRMVDIYGDSLPVALLRRRVGMVFQSPNPLPMSIYKNIMFPLKLAGQRNNGEMVEKVEEMLMKVHLFDEVKDRLHSDARILSGGQQQRLCIARTLMLDPEILLLDEPTSSLDKKGSIRIEELLLELRSERTLLLVSHYKDQISRVADRTYELAGKCLIQIS